MKRAIEELIFTIFKVLIVVIVLTLIIVQFLTILMPKPSIAFNDLAEWVSNRIINCDQLYKILSDAERNNQHICFYTNNKDKVYFYALPLNVKCEEAELDKYNPIIYSVKSIKLETEKGIVLPFDSRNVVDDLLSIYQKYCQSCLRIYFKVENKESIYAYWGDNVYLVLENNCNGKVKFTVKLPDYLDLSLDNRKIIDGELNSRETKEFLLKYNNFIGTFPIELTSYINDKQISYLTYFTINYPIVKADVTYETSFGVNQFVINVYFYSSENYPKVSIRLSNGRIINCQVYMNSESEDKKEYITDCQISDQSLKQYFENKKPLFFIIESKSTNGHYIEIVNYSSSES